MVRNGVMGPDDLRAEWRPSVNPWLVAASVMLATFMVVLDCSVANVALPHMAGGRNRRWATPRASIT